MPRVVAAGDPSGKKVHASGSGADAAGVAPFLRLRSLVVLTRSESVVRAGEQTPGRDRRKASPRMAGRGGSGHRFAHGESSARRDRWASSDGRPPTNDGRSLSRKSTPCVLMALFLCSFVRYRACTSRTNVSFLQCVRQTSTNRVRPVPSPLPFGPPRRWSAVAAVAVPRRCTPWLVRGCTDGSRVHRRLPNHVRDRPLPYGLWHSTRRTGRHDDSATLR